MDEDRELAWCTPSARKPLCVTARLLYLTQIMGCSYLSVKPTRLKLIGVLTLQASDLNSACLRTAITNLLNIYDINQKHLAFKLN